MSCFSRSKAIKTFTSHPNKAQTDIFTLSVARSTSSNPNDMVDSESWGHKTFVVNQSECLQSVENDTKNFHVKCKPPSADSPLENCWPNPDSVIPSVSSFSILHNTTIVRRDWVEKSSSIKRHPKLEKAFQLSQPKHSRNVTELPRNYGHFFSIGSFKAETHFDKFQSFTNTTVSTLRRPISFTCRLGNLLKNTRISIIVVLFLFLSNKTWSDLREVI